MISKVNKNDNSFVIEIQNRLDDDFRLKIFYEVKNLYLRLSDLFEVENKYTEILEEKTSFQTTYLNNLINIVAYHFRINNDYQNFELYRNQEDIEEDILLKWRQFIEQTVKNLIADNKHLKNLVKIFCEEKLLPNGHFDYSEESYNASELVCYIYIKKNYLQKEDIYFIDMDRLEKLYGNIFEE